MADSHRVRQLSLLLAWTDQYKDGSVPTNANMAKIRKATPDLSESERDDAFSKVSAAAVDPYEPVKDKLLRFRV